MSAAQAADLFEVRLAVEPLGARLAAAGRSPASCRAHIARMKEILAEAQASPAELDLDRLSGLHTELHSLVFEMTGNSLPDRHRHSHGQARAVAAAAERALRTPSAWSQHHGLISAIEAGDADLAEAVARHHVLTVRGDLLSGRRPTEHARRPAEARAAG